MKERKEYRGADGRRGKGRVRRGGERRGETRIVEGCRKIRERREEV